MEQLVQRGLGGGLLQPVQIVHLGEAQHLNPVGVDEIEVADQRLRRALLVVAYHIVGAAGARDPGQVELLLVFLVQTADADARHWAPNY